MEKYNSRNVTWISKLTQENLWSLPESSFQPQCIFMIPSHFLNHKNDHFPYLSLELPPPSILYAFISPYQAAYCNLLRFTTTINLYMSRILKFSLLQPFLVQILTQAFSYQVLVMCMLGSSVQFIELSKTY
jgi:hypothetical protein